MANCRILKLACCLWFVSTGCLAVVNVNSSVQVVPQVYRVIAAAERVPAESLYSLAMAESTRKTAWGSKPWPWTINVAGKGYHFETREEAFAALLGFMQRYPMEYLCTRCNRYALGS